MAEDSFDRTLERLLAYPESSRAEPGAFVAGVMQEVGREQRTRKLILWVFGLIGGLFGLAGAAILSPKITWLFTDALNATTMMQFVLFVIAAVIFYLWIMNDDMTVAG